MYIKSIAYEKISGHPSYFLCSCCIGQGVSCSGLSDLISNANTSELSQCVMFGGCSGIQCTNLFGQFRRFVEIFNFTLLPCEEPSPAILVRLLGERDPTINNMRREVYKHCLLYTSPSPRDATLSRMPSSA